MAGGEGDAVDWYGWNQALALISLVGTSASVEAAAEMDASFWRFTSRIKDVEAYDETVWAEIVSDLKVTRLKFINGARRDIVGLNARLT